MCRAQTIHLVAREGDRESAREEGEHRQRRQRGRVASRCQRSGPQHGEEHSLGHSEGEDPDERDTRLGADARIGERDREEDAQVERADPPHHAQHSAEDQERDHADPEPPEGPPIAAHLRLCRRDSGARDGQQVPSSQIEEEHGHGDIGAEALFLHEGEAGLAIAHAAHHHGCQALE